MTKARVNPKTVKRTTDQPSSWNIGLSAGETKRSIRKQEPTQSTNKGKSQHIQILDTIDPNKTFKPKNWRNITCYRSNSQFGDKVTKIVAKSLGLETESVFSGPNPGLNVNFGIIRGADLLVKECWKKKIPLLYFDHAYFSSGHKTERPVYRATLNLLQKNFFEERPLDRLRMFDLDIRSWKQGGDYILICPPSQSVMNMYGCWNWLEETTKEIRKYTSRPIRVRHKPGEKPLEFSKGYANPVGSKDKTTSKNIPSLMEDLDNAWAVVTYTSKVGIEAALYGVPVFCSKHSASIGFGTSDLSLIESPLRPDRISWLASLAYGQFYLDEIADGYFWKYLDL